MATGSHWQLRLSSSGFKLGETLVFTLLAFYLVFFSSESWYWHRVVPQLVKESPHDAQIGLGGFIGATNLALISAAVVLVVGLAIALKTAVRPAIAVITARQLVRFGLAWFLGATVTLAIVLTNHHGTAGLIRSGTFDWQGQPILLATTVVVALGWSIPLTAGLAITTRRR